ncbi:DSBA-like thioredoxin domain-containing protein [Phlyctema vagabunda]|uniref:DSBA-like thioredoxin domain-containing protein n=1 Tax=Phlyctema vagabunda TaxID=108571 RepID=A0ABR4PWX4_9HELO
MLALCAVNHNMASPACPGPALRQDCTYDTPIKLPSPGTTLDDQLVSSGSIPSDIKADIIEKMSGFQPADIAAKCVSDLDPWLPIMTPSRLSDKLPSSWEDATVDFALLCFTILLLTTEPEGEEEECGNLSSNLKSTYVLSKGWSALLEAQGLNSLHLVESRLLLTVFEVLHGLYPAAYISLGAVVRASDALSGYCGYSVPVNRQYDSDQNVGECITKSAIAIIDRYVTMEHGKQPSLTRDRPFLDRMPSLEPEPSEGTFNPPNKEFSRLFEASSLLEKAHMTLNEPLMEKAYNVEEVTVIAQTLMSFETVLRQELPENRTTYSAAFVMCQMSAVSHTRFVIMLMVISAFIAVYENGTKVDPSDINYSPCPFAARIKLDEVLDNLLIMIQPTLDSREEIDVKALPPFLIYLMYKSADIVTERLRKGEETVDEDGLLECFLASKRITRAVSAYKQQHEGDTVIINWKPFRLRPDAPKESIPLSSFIESRFGRGSFDKFMAHEDALGRPLGIKFNPNRPMGDTLDSHRFVYLAGKKSNEVQSALVENLFSGHFEGGQDFASRAFLVKAATEAGIDSKEALEWLDSGAGTDEVEAEIHNAVVQGVRAVPNITIAGKYPMPGNYSESIIIQALERARKENGA